MNKTKLTYRITTGLFTALIGMGAVMYFVQHDMVADKFATLGYPAYIICPLAIAKLLGLTAILTRKSPLLTNLAYAGFFYELILAATAHVAIGDGEFAPATAALALAIASWETGRRLYPSSAA
ncbi:MAG: DoxX family protein [Myxococcota bacterium]